ncbi:calcium-regulated heat stable protein 1-like isoform X2 [Saccoglossus kowalevskii]|uniref:Calcium-regulated heat stable protein 1-like isoform X1 n=1 Tax=Saccoglossus kowalevskii TaxID=10224 RepID=A0ABM0GUA4_SACKO|nr:PREDICTED: calcium-regulated heat stable protein 1-like isoform X1 [Saccoglossus kowalevskii]XP_006819876.1 PREDICTED: calcium-regulated heat stable protein 1-like isoform X2 [Saccoglossus kowalevskii]
MATTPDKSPGPRSPISGREFLLPSPIVTRRTRTFSTSKSASQNPVKKGTVKYFCRHKGHGFITQAEENAEELFVHISDIEGEYIPVVGDQVTYKECLIPPKKTKTQAVEVIITHLAPDVKHHRWEDPDDD